MTDLKRTRGDLLSAQEDVVRVGVALTAESGGEARRGEDSTEVRRSRQCREYQNESKERKPSASQTRQ
jgi:hypothetical protein